MVLRYLTFEHKFFVIRILPEDRIGYCGLPAQTAMGREHSLLAKPLNSLAALMLEMGHSLDQAAQLAQRAYAIR